MAQTLLALRNVEVRYGDFCALRVPHLSVARGEILAVIGPNGSGKSTLIRVMGALQRPGRGEIEFDGSNVDTGNALSLRRRIAIVFQDPLLLNETLYENAALGLKLRGLDRKSVAERVDPWLDRFGIGHLVQRRARSLSGGEARRTSLVRALALGPELLLLDEPFSALDPPTRERLLLELETVLRDTGITTVFVTHDRNEAFMLADRIAVLIEGEILQMGSAAEVFARPADDRVAEFVGIDNRIPGIVEQVTDGLARVRCASASAEVVGALKPGERVLLCVRPEDVAINFPAADLKSSARNQFLGKVTKVTPWGSHYRLAVKHGSILFITFISRRSFSDLQLRDGTTVIASFEPSMVHVIRHRPHE
jgi:tungstate transport system ATP-binding protein